MKPTIKAIYLVVENMERVVEFYEDILDRKISIFDSRMSSFDFEHTSILLFNPRIDGEKVVIGNNVVPNIEVGNVDKMLKKNYKTKL